MNLVSQGAGRDRDRNRPGRLADEPLRTGEEDFAAMEHLLQLGALQGHHLGDGPAARRQFAVACQRLQQADVVVAEIARVVLLGGERDAILGQRFLEGLQVKGLAVRDDAVEVEHDRL